MFRPFSPRRYEIIQALQKAGFLGLPPETAAKGMRMGRQIAQDRGAPAAASEPAAKRKTAFAGMALGSLGVVFGDIGTSPLYALRESLSHIKDVGRARDRRDWNRLPAHVGAVLYRDREICAVSHARGQQGAKAASSP